MTDLVYALFGVHLAEGSLAFALFGVDLAEPPPGVFGLSVGQLEQVAEQWRRPCR